MTAAAGAALGTTVMTALLGIVRLGTVGPLSSTSAYDLIPLLGAAGFLCLAGLTRQLSPTTFRLATIGAAFVLTIDLAAYARLVRPSVGEEAWRWLGLAVSISALLAVGSAAAYAASRPRLRRRWLTVEGAIVLVVVATVAGWAVANPSDPTIATGSALGSLSLVTRSFIVLTAGFTLLGVVGDAMPAAERARHRVGLTQRRTAPPGKRGVAWLRAFADELSPGRRRARRAVLAERSRVARDIHADVVPGLRRVLADAERGVPPERLAGALREVLVDVEAVGAVQHPIQLEIGGLVAALEWLAERIESRSDISVTLNVADHGRVSTGEPPPEVAAAAFRIAALALGNVARHAPASNAVVDVRADADAVDLAIHDDGPGISDAAVATAQAAGRRGIADMAAEADECGGVVDVGPGPGGEGTSVAFAWRSAAGR